MPTTRIALLAAALVAAAGPSSSSAASRTIALRAHGTGGSQHGDRLTFTERLTRPTSGKRMGHDAVTCTGAKGSVLHCTATISLRQGSLRVKGDLTHSATNHLTVTSGTGAFAGATGTVVVRSRGDDTSDITVTLG